MSNAAIDYEKQNELNNARLGSSRVENFNVPRNGLADNYNQGIHRVHDESEDELRNNPRLVEDGEDDKHAERLGKARAGSGNSEAKKTENLATDAAKMATPMGAMSLLKQINPIGDMPFVAAIGASMLKDLSDLVFIGSLPGVGTVITIMCSIFIFMMMLLVGGGGKKKVANGLVKKGGIILAGTLAGFMPGINFIPEATATALVVYFTTLSERKHEQE
ncbi:MAG: hypothetical protein ACD_56C00037G0012 [uncultured bacterium]|nr:MAG: hypothetical protein ACD_56C00037G0012 [uncultured bacterium]